MNTTTKEISNTDDIIDSRDIIARIEELRELLPDRADEVMPGTSDEIAEARYELARLEAFMEELAGNGGDEKWGSGG